jgi:AbrB family looped-hinge helix DNA binding protein
MKELKVPELTKASSKGQIVIPSVVRRKLGIKRGSVFAVSAKNDMIVLKKLDTGIKPEDLMTLKLIEEGWEDIEKGRFKKASPEKFFKELAKWKR